MLYTAPPFVLDSNIAFPELEPATRGAMSWTFRVVQGLPDDGVSDQWFEAWELPDGRPLLAIARRDGGYALRFHGFADFLVAPHERRIACRPLRGTQFNTIRHLLLDQVLPLMMADAGMLALHASAVALPGMAVAGFLAPSGFGKSTLAAALAASGSALVTDDCLLLEQIEGGFRARPSYRGLRLWTDSRMALFQERAGRAAVAQYTTKERVDSRELAWQVEDALLRCLYVLQPPGEHKGPPPATITRAPARAAVIELVKYAFLLDIQDPAHIARQFEQVSWLAERVPIFALGYTRQIDLLPELCQAIVAHAMSLQREDGTRSGEVAAE